MKTFDQQFDFLIREFGKKIKLNEEETTAILIDEFVSTAEKYYNDKKIYTRERLKNGDLVFYDNYYWYVINLPVQLNNCSYANIRQATNLINIFSKSINNIRQNNVNIYPEGVTIPCIAQIGTINVNNSGLTGNLQASIQRQATTISLSSETPIVFGNHTWKIITLGDQKPGMLELYATIDTNNNQEDNYVDGIPAQFSSYKLESAPLDLGGLRGRAEYFPNEQIELNIINSSTEIKVGETLSLELQCLINEEDFSRYNGYTWTQYATVEIISGSENATLTNQIKYLNGFEGSTSFLSSILKGIKVGQVTVQLNYKGQSAQKTFNIVEADDKYEIQISGPDDILVGQKYRYEFTILKNEEEWTPPGASDQWKKDGVVNITPENSATYSWVSIDYWTDLALDLTIGNNVYDDIELTYSYQIPDGPLVSKTKSLNNTTPSPKTYKLELIGQTPIEVGNNSTLSLNFYENNELFEPSGTWKREVSIVSTIGEISYNDTSENGGREWILLTNNLSISEDTTAKITATYIYNSQTYTSSTDILITAIEQPDYSYKLEISSVDSAQAGDEIPINILFYRNEQEWNPEENWKRNVQVTSSSGTITETDIIGNGGRTFVLNTNSITENSIITITANYLFNNNNYQDTKQINITYTPPSVYNLQLNVISDNIIASDNIDINPSFYKDGEQFIPYGDWKATVEMNSSIGEIVINRLNNTGNNPDTSQYTIAQNNNQDSIDVVSRGGAVFNLNTDNVQENYPYTSVISASYQYLGQIYTANIQITVNEDTSQNTYELKLNPESADVTKGETVEFIPVFYKNNEVFNPQENWALNNLNISSILEFSIESANNDSGVIIKCTVPNDTEITEDTLTVSYTYLNNVYTTSANITVTDFNPDNYELNIDFNYSGSTTVRWALYMLDKRTNEKIIPFDSWYNYVTFKSSSTRVTNFRLYSILDDNTVLISSTKTYGIAFSTTITATFVWNEHTFTDSVSHSFTS